MVKKIMRIEEGFFSRTSLKRGQVTLFIILVIMIVSIVLIFFLWIRPNYLTDRGGNLGFEGCVLDASERAILELGLSAGFVNPEFTYTYLEEEVPYLCYTNEYYQTCVVQKPFLKQHFETNLKNFIREEVNTCYENSLNSLKEKGYEVVSGNLDYNISIEPRVVLISIEAPTSIGTQNFARFNVRVNSQLYELLGISTSLLQYESVYGDSDTTSLLALYPEYLVRKMKRGDGTTIYTVEDKMSETKFRFASRSLAWPPGYRQ